MGVLADAPITHAVPVLLEETDNEDDLIDDGLAQAFNNLEVWVFEESDDDDDGTDDDNCQGQRRTPVWELEK